MIYFITGSENKFNEAKAIMPALERVDIDLPEIQEIDAHSIITAKLEAAFEHHSGPFVVEDTSLYLQSLNGLPGPLIKWFMKTIGNDGLVKIAASLGSDRATAKTIIGYASARGESVFFEGAVEGRIVPVRGSEGFGWDPIFLPDGYDHTFAEMTPEEKNGLSMRRAAFEQLAKELGA